MIAQLRAALRRRRVPYVAQLQAAECGAACLAMILEHFGAYVPLPIVRDLCGVSRDGTSALAIVKGARALGLHARAQRLGIAALREVPTPAILHWKLSHFVVLESIDAKGAHLVDPAYGRRFVTLAELDRAFTGVVLVMTPTASMVRRRRRALSARRYLALLGRARSGVRVVVGSALLLELVAMAFPAVSQIVVDLVWRPHQDRWLWFLCGALAGAAALKVVLARARDRTLAGLRMALDAQLVTGFMQHQLALPLAFFDQRGIGELMSAVQSNAAIRDGLAEATTAFLDAVLVVTYAALMLAYDPRLAALVLAVAAVRAAAIAMTARAAEDATTSELVALAREQEAMIAAFSAPEATKAFRTEELLVDRFERRSVTRVNATFARRGIIEATSRLMPALDGLAKGLILWFGGLAVIDARITLGVFGAFLAIDALLARPIAALVTTFDKLEQVRGQLRRLDDVWSTPPEPRGTVDPGAIGGAITLEEVSFRYAPSRPDVIADVSLTIAPGETIAIVGPSGSGKTTLAKLLVGLVAPTRGVVRVGEHDARELDPDALRRQIGVVLQDARFRDDTVRANLAFDDPDVPLDAVRSAARTACVDEVIDALPLGYATRVGENAGHLSGGQRQRLALARALVKEPRVLVLDEATSALDPALEARLRVNLAALRCTRIVIAHRLAAVRDADRIVVLSGGRVVQTGTFDELSARPGLFQELSRALPA